ncbi:hypothetical protein MAPG_02215 [Magnaporthiopsis poae ATCC 64411]|uniref:Uncharacterized protein n=1 Tax=Magnaporthiopsis poae (strain ATCC 64411 / 73-15) TaxID=644358 RepID=A0A0C4DQR9_MAGP6|nr:hypothetical protein MAPG_02215 [Magnaporthiopsis poae ATCC 64411]
MAGYGTVPTDKNASVAVIDPGTYLGDPSASRLSATDIGVIAGVSVFFGVLVIVIFAWQIRAIRDRKRLTSGRSSPGGGGGGGGRFKKGSGRSGDDEDDYGAAHAHKDDEVELKEFDGAATPAPAAAATRDHPRAPEQPAAMFKIPNKGMLPPPPPLPPLPPPPPLPSRHSEHRFSVGSKEGAHDSHYTVTSLLKALREGKTKDSGGE